MLMEHSEQQIQQQSNGEPSYWPSVGIAALIFGIISFAIYLLSSYLTINSEPTGSMLGPSMLIGIFSCLIGAFAGFTAVWHYTREYNIALTLGKGALVGFLAGAGMTAVSALLTQAWTLVDPELTQKLIDSTIANLEQMENLPAENRDQMIDQMVESMRSSTTLGGQLLWGIPISGILNLLSGMIGVKVFGKKEE